MGKFQAGLFEELSLYVRQSAWLSTVPERPKGDKGEGPHLTRLQKMRETEKNDLYLPEMPPVDAPHLIAHLWEIGPALSGGMGPAPITHEEICAWQALTGIELNPWEVRSLRRLSREYIGEMQRAEKIDAKAPWQPADYVPDLSAVAMDMRAEMRKDAAL